VSYQPSIYAFLCQIRNPYWLLLLLLLLRCCAAAAIAAAAAVAVAIPPPNWVLNFVVVCSKPTAAVACIYKQLWCITHSHQHGSRRRYKLE
jgi:hypothetical protein